MNLIKEKKVITRKPRRCWGCTRLFSEKTKMHFVVSVDCGEISNAYWCEDCQDFMSTLHPDDCQDGFAMGELLNYDEYKKHIQEANQ